MQKLLLDSCRSSCFSQDLDKILLWISDSQLIAENPHDLSGTVEHPHHPDFNWKCCVNNSVL